MRKRTKRENHYSQKKSGVSRCAHILQSFLKNSIGNLNDSFQQTHDLNWAEIIPGPLRRYIRSIPPELLLGKDVLKICSKFSGEHPWQSVISIKLLCNFIEVALCHGCSPEKFAAYFQNTFLHEHLWRAASVIWTCPILSI